LDCPKPFKSVKECEECAKSHQAEFKAAGCTIPDVESYCQPALTFPNVTRPCLFDIRADPSESNDLLDDLSPSPAVQQLLATMEAKYQNHCSTFFQSTHIFADDQHNKQQKCESTAAYVTAHRGFKGPICK
jgi:hypothetical protein